eukprot:TRINITY_DN2516_c0_g1_i4.p1 TRINITY_DN2516_c0_g1~~TRINITY_DN2516_c0_g1_i4.p1  ORF type:complete len:104 (-),score=0.60 TRINITY_DN2516_c0_g1_i4:672-983(-)
MEKDMANIGEEEEDKEWSVGTAYGGLLPVHHTCEYLSYIVLSVFHPLIYSCHNPFMHKPNYISLNIINKYKLHFYLCYWGTRSPCIDAFACRDMVTLGKFRYL